MVSFHVLRCAQCETFQALQVTKSQKWKCKLCGQKQSVIKVYGEGTGAECRRHVQKLNTLRGQADLVLEYKHLKASVADEFTSGSSSSDNPGCVIEKPESRWSCFLENHDEDEESELSTEAYQGSGLQGHVTTDWNEFTKRKREIHTGFQKRKLFKPNQHGFSKKASYKELPEESKLQCFSFAEKAQPAPQQLKNCCPKFATPNDNRQLITEHKCKINKECVDNIHKNFAPEKGVLLSSHVPIAKHNFSTLSSMALGTSKEQKLDSIIKPPQNKAHAKQKLLTQSKWSMFLNEDSEEENNSEDSGSEVPVCN